MNIKKIFLCLILISGKTAAQHSLELDNAGAFSVIQGSNPGGNYILPSGGGTLLTSGSSSLWFTQGNSITGVDGTNNVLGTTAASPLLPVNFFVGGTQVFRLQTNYCIVGGYMGNSIDASSVSSVISGGGDLGAANIISNASYSTIAGGTSNSISNVQFAAIGGGTANTADGQGSFVGGGGFDGSTTAGNSASGSASAVLAGLGNSASGDYSCIGGGQNNTAQTKYAVIAGGQNNTVSGAEWQTVGGGFSNSSLGTSTTVAGGEFNSASGFGATVSGGGGNQAQGDFSTISGGNGAIASNIGQLSYANGHISQNGDAQTSLFVLHGVMAAAGGNAILTLHGLGDDIQMPPGTCWAFRITVVAQVKGGNGLGGTFMAEGNATNVAGTVTIVLSPTTTYNNGYGTGVSIAAVGGPINSPPNSLRIFVHDAAGQANNIIGLVARVETTEITF